MVGWVTGGEVGLSVGMELVGLFVVVVFLVEGAEVGASVGVLVVGVLVATGRAVGVLEGTTVGLSVGVLVTGAEVGLATGVKVGLAIGFKVGLAIGVNVGLAIGFADGVEEGRAVGDFVGKVEPTTPSFVVAAYTTTSEVAPAPGVALEMLLRVLVNALVDNALLMRTFAFSRADLGSLV